MDEQELEERLRNFGEFLAAMTEEERKKWQEKTVVAFSARLDQALAKYRDENNLDSISE